MMSRSLASDGVAWASSNVTIATARSTGPSASRFNLIDVSRSWNGMHCRRRADAALGDYCDFALAGAPLTLALRPASRARRRSVGAYEVCRPVGLPHAVVIRKRLLPTSMIAVDLVPGEPDL